MTNIYEEKHYRQNLSDNADQTEISAVKTGAAPIEEGLYDERVADAMDDFGTGDNISPYDDPVRIEEDLQQDDAIGGLLAIVECRQRIMDCAYPFQITRNSLIHCLSKTLVYEFCLRISTTNVSHHPELPRVFEQLSHILVKCYLGQFGRSLHTGWPRTQPKLKDAVSPLYEETKEWYWQPDLGLPDNPSSTHFKDEGLDFVAWIHNLDNRAGHLFLLGQCACGGNWENKYTDISADFVRIKRWFGPMTYVHPVRAFCTPFHVTEPLLIEASSQAGLVFDRLRLTLLAETAPQKIKDEIAALDLAQYLELPDVG